MKTVPISGSRVDKAAEDDIDWSLTTWEGSRRVQLRRALEMTVRERLEVAEGLADVARRFDEIRRAGGFKNAPGSEQNTPMPQPASELLSLSQGEEL